MFFLMISFLYVFVVVVAVVVFVTHLRRKTFSFSRWSSGAVLNFSVNDDVRLFAIVVVVVVVRCKCC